MSTPPDDVDSERFQKAAEDLAKVVGNISVEEAKVKMAAMIEAFAAEDLTTGETFDISETTEVTPTDGMWFDAHTDGGYRVSCTCGQKKTHPRGKVLVKWARRHTDKTGHVWRGQNGARTIEDFERIVG